MILLSALKKKHLKLTHSAFTLAEVLITLSIIGVVAAMTIPTLISQHQKQATVVKVKKVYSIFSQAFEMSKIENGPVSSWTSVSGKDLYDKYLAQFIPSITTSVEQGLWGHFNASDGVKITLKDGTIVVLSRTNPINIIVYFKTPTYLFEGTGLDPQKDRFYFFVDSNGKVAPPHMEDTRAENIQNCESYNIIGNNGYMDCSTIIIKDSWEIKDDYPW